MAQQVFKIADATDVKLISRGDTHGEKGIKSMTISNIHSGSATVDLYLKNEAGTIYYIFKSLKIYTGSTLKLEGDEVSFNNKLYDLYINLAGTTPVDVIIN
jgi:hypothetical protein